MIRALLVAMAILVAGGLAACRDEDERVVHLGTGKYPGKSDQKPSALSNSTMANDAASELS